MIKNYIIINTLTYLVLATSCITLTACNNHTKPKMILPKITLIGENPQQLIVESTYTELGAIAYDNDGKNITENIVIDSTRVDTETEGNYTVTYSVLDSTGNSLIEETRTVEVIEAFINIDNKTTHISLSAGIKQKLRFINGEVLEWKSDSTAIDIDSQGYVYAKKTPSQKILKFI